jgi:AhpD family alkylhydroperoxidase
MADFFSKETIKNLRKLRQLKPDLFKALMDWDDMIFQDGALPAKTKELMAVTAAHVTDCPWCIEEHVRRAIKQGATDEEIAEAAFVAMSLRAGAACAHSSIAMAVSDEQRAKAAAHAPGHEGHNH